MRPVPYRSTPIFDEVSLPAALRRDHSTKAGVWGVVRVIEGELMLGFADGRSIVLKSGDSGLIRPEEPHWVMLRGEMKMQVDFYDREPDLSIVEADA